MTNKPDSMLAVIEQAVINPDVDVEKMSRLMDIQERIMDKNAAQAYAQAMSECQKECPRVIHNKTNQNTGSTYSDYDAVNNIIKPIYVKHGFSLMFGTDTAKNPDEVKVTCICLHSQGHSKHFEIDVPYDQLGPKGNPVKTRTHAAISSISYGQRYLLEMIFNVSTGKDDDGNQGRSHAQTTEYFLNLINTILEHVDTISVIKANLRKFESEIGLDYTDPDLSIAAEEWYGLTQDEQRALWVAPTKGGPFSVLERKIMKTNAFRDAHYGPRKNET